jgi:hypothetical protein
VISWGDFAGGILCVKLARQLILIGGNRGNGELDLGIPSKAGFSNASAPFPPFPPVQKKFVS